MEKRISSFLSIPHFEDPKENQQANLLNQVLFFAAICCAAGLVITLINTAWTLAISLSVLLVLVVISKIVMQQRHVRFASFFFLGSLSLFSLLFNALLPEWPMAGISLALVSMTGFLLLNFSWSLILFGINLLGYVLLTIPAWSAEFSRLFPLLGISLSVLFLLWLFRLYTKASLQREEHLRRLCERLEQETARLTMILAETTSQLTGEIEARKSLEMRMQDELERDPSHRFNPQTGIYTEKAIMELIEQEISRTRRYQRPLSLLCIRVDSLYSVVDKARLTPGKLLSMLSDTFNGTLRREDILGHCGEDGFYILLPETGRYASYVVAERLRHLVEVISLFDDEDDSPLTISIGLTASQDQAKMNAEIFTAQSKDALTAAEQHGGNWTISWHDLNHTPA